MSFRWGCPFARFGTVSLGEEGASTSVIKGSSHRKKIVIPILYRSVALPPFLEDKVYIDFEKSYFGGLARLVAFVHELDKRTVNNELSKREPKSMAMLKKILKLSGWRSQVVSDADVYHAIQRLYEQRGRKVSPEIFRILVDEWDDEDPPPPPLALA